MTQPMKPQFLADIVAFTRWTIQNPMNGMDYLEMSLHDAVFLVDFGPWKQGHRPYKLTFDPFHGTLSEGNQRDELVACCRIGIVCTAVITVPGAAVTASGEIPSITAMEASGKTARIDKEV